MLTCSVILLLLHHLVYHGSYIRDGDFDEYLWCGDGDLLRNAFPSFTNVFNFVKCVKAL